MAEGGGTGKDRVVLVRSDPDSNQTMTSARQHAEQRLKKGPCRCDRYPVGSPPQR
jgi:hypothetical protein